MRNAESEIAITIFHSAPPHLRTSAYKNNIQKHGKRDKSESTYIYHYGTKDIPS